MIKDIQELNFPSYATMSAAAVAQPDMGEWNITSQMKIDGQITPDFTYDWEVVYKGHKYIMPLRKPQGSKENTSLNATVDLTFKHWAMYQLQRYFFFETASVGADTVIPDKYVASVNLNLENFCILFSRVLEYYFGDKITLDIDQATIQTATTDVQQVEISYAFIWDVLLKFHEVYGVRWQIEPNGSPDKYVIKIRYGSGVELSHIFEYGFKGGLLKVERQVQNPDIRNIVLGRGGEKNLPYRYFKDVDHNNPGFKADPDWIPELARVPFTQLHGATFRSYIRGWKAKHHGGTTTAEDCYAPWAWEKGYTDTTFSPVEFVYDEQSIAFYGELWGALDDNEDIYPSIQNRVRDGIGRIDEVVAVEPINSDDYVATAEKESQKYSANLCGAVTQIVDPNGRVTIKLVGGTFTIQEGLTGNLDVGTAAVEAWSVSQIAGRRPMIDVRFPNADKYLVVESVTVTVNGNQSASGLPAGTYSWAAEIKVHNTSNMTLGVKAQLPKPQVIASDVDNGFRNTWCVWIKDVFNTPKPANKSAEAFAAEVWDPLLGDHLGEEAALFFTSGMLSASEDYKFLLAKRPEYDTSESIEVEGVGTVQSMWKLTLQKSDADFEATGKWLPSTMRQASAGDHFAFEGIELPHSYVLMAEEEIDNAKLDYLGKFKDIKPTWVVSLDRVRISTAQADEVTALINQITPGAAVRLHDPRFILNAQGTPAAYETLYISNVNITYREPTSNDAALNPDVEITLSDKYEMAASTVQRMQSEIDALTRQVGSIGNIEQIVRAVGDKLYLRKDGISDISMSPTQFFSLLTSGDFRNGMVGGAGWGFFRDANGNWVLETDRVNVRQEMLVNSLVINQVKGQGGTIVESAAVIEEVTDVIEDNSGIYCYFDTKSGTLINQFRVDDVAYCSRYLPTSQADDANGATFSTVKFYKRRVIAVGDNYIKLSLTDVDGSGYPAKGDAIIHYGNYTDKQRQFVKVRDVIGGGYERYIEGLDSVDATGTEYYFVGRQAGMYNNRPRFYIGDTDGYIEWVDGVLNIKGKLNTLSTVGDTTIGDYVNNAAQEAADAAKTELQGKIDALQNQVDGVVEAWSYPYTPTASNYPADQWTTEGEKNAHVGDVFYNIQPAYNADGTANPDAGKAWRWSQGDTEHGGTYHWHPIADSDAVRALQLAQMSVLDTDVLYTQHTSQTDAPTLPVVNTSGTITNPNGWSTNAPAYEAGKYIWQTTYVKKGDGQASFSDPTCISGRDGTSITISSQSVKYSTNHGSTQPADNTFTLTAVPTLTAGQYLWSMTTVTYSNGQSTKSYAVSRIGTNGQDGTNGTSITITSTSVTYAKSSNATQPADSAFAYTSIGAAGLGAGDYLWTKTEVTYSDGSSTKSYSVGRIGADGDDGIPGTPGTDGKTTYVHFAYASGITGNLPHPTTISGFSATSFVGAKYIGVCTDYNQADPTTNVAQTYEWSEYKGNGIDHIEEEYFLSTSRTALQGGSWSTTRQPWVAGRFYWTRSHVYYTDGTDETYGEVCVTGESGAAAPNLVIKYSATGGTAESEWHPTYTAGDVWMKTSNDGGTTWSAAMRVQGASYSPNLLKNKYRINSSEGTLIDNGVELTTKNADTYFYIDLDDGVVLSTYKGQTITFSCMCEGLPSGEFYKFNLNNDWTKDTIVIDKNGLNVTVFTLTSSFTDKANARLLLDDIKRPATVGAKVKITRCCLTIGDNPNQQYVPAASEMVGQDGKWRKFQWALGTETAVTGTWQDAPMNAPTGQYVWMRSGVVAPPATDPATWETATRLTGDKGQSGDSVYMLDLSDEMMPMPCDAAGNVVGTYSTSQASVYKGGTKVASGITYSIVQQTGVSATITSAGVVTPSALTADRGTIVVQAVVAGVTLQTTLSLYKVKPGTDGSNYSDNLYLNSAYEKGTDEWVVWSGSKDYTGSELLVAPSNGQQIVSNRKIEVKAGEKFTLSGWLKTDSFVGGANASFLLNYCYLLYASGGNIAIRGFITDNTVTTEWKFFVLQFTAPRDGMASPGFGYSSSLNPYLYLKQLKWERGYNDNPVWTPNSSEMVGQDGQDAVVYQLELSANNVSRNALGQLSATSITAQKYKTTGASARALTTEKKIRYQRLGVDTGYTEVQSGVNSTSISVPNDPALTAIVVELLDTDNTVLDRERVPLIQDGAELTDNLVLNSEVNITNNNYSIAKFTLSEDIVIGETYTFTIWGNAAGGRAFHPFDSLGGYEFCKCQQIAPGVYSGVATIGSGMANRNKRTVNVYVGTSSNQPGASDMSTIKRIKVEKGTNLAPVWTQSPHDMDYLKKAMQENGSMEGGLILASLMQMGFTDSDGTYKKKAGVSGIAVKADDLAFWAGGEMIDPDKQPSATNKPTFGIRHDGTGFASNNTIRFKDELIEVGEYIKLTDQQLNMTIDGKKKLVVGNEKIEGTYVLRAKKGFSLQLDKTFPTQTIYYSYDPTSSSKKYLKCYYPQLPFTQTTTIESFAAKKQTITFSPSKVTLTAPVGGDGEARWDDIPYLHLLITDSNGQTLASKEYHAVDFKDGLFDYTLEPITLQSNASSLTFRFQLRNAGYSQSDAIKWGQTKSIGISLVAANSSGAISCSLAVAEADRDYVTILGKDGVQFSWGDTHQYQQNGLWGVRVGNYGLMINSSGIFVMINGETHISLKDYIKGVVNGTY